MNEYAKDYRDILRSIHESAFLKLSIPFHARQVHSPTYNFCNILLLTLHLPSLSLVQEWHLQEQCLFTEGS